MHNLTAKVGGTLVAGRLHPASRPVSGAPLIVTLHGGLFTGRYFEVAGSDAGSFVDIASRNGFGVLVIDRPGYGESGQPSADYDYAFPEQARVIDAAIAELAAQCDDPQILLIGHSVGGMISFEIAARQPSWNLVGLSTTGMGARIPRGGAAEQLGTLPLSGVVDLPIAEREKLWYGPEHTYTAAGVAAARTSYAPAPMTELTAAPKWASSRLDSVAAHIAVPIYHALAEFDALWDGSPDARRLFLSKFNATQRVNSEIIEGVGHSIDHHLIGAAIHYKQLAFAHACVCQSRTDQHP
ncbi:MAG: alpha/beta hydrolase [Mycobacterium sp.]|uniref:alpha/beta hydrolase n=1 Tax=Mycobacterium sp. TaxID=1785 RepID=UPI003CC68FCD